MNECVDCGGPRSDRSKSGRCRLCATIATGRANRKPPRLCRDCGAKISHASRGRCVPCARTYINESEEIKRRRIEGIHRKMRDPRHMEKLQRLGRINGRKAAQNPEHMAWLKENGKRAYREILSRPDVRAKCREALKGIGPKITEYWLGWCPPDKRDEYRWLTKSKRMKAAEAKKIILDGLSPFERQMNALRMGAALASNPQKTSLANPGYHDEKPQVPVDKSQPVSNSRVQHGIERNENRQEDLAA